MLDRVPGAAGRVEAVCACGQMHGTVLVDADGRPTRDAVPLWNDKRTLGEVAAFEAAHRPEDYLAATGNPATPAWPGFKLGWLRDHDPDAYGRATHVLMPKDFVNLRLTGERAMDRGDASLSFLMDPAHRRVVAPPWPRALGVDLGVLPPIRDGLDVLGGVTAAAAAATGLREGTPVLVGAADYPAALLGSGVCRPGLASDVTGTSCILTTDRRRRRCSTPRSATSRPSRGTGDPSCCWNRAATRCAGRGAPSSAARAATSPSDRRGRGRRAGLRRAAVHALSSRASGSAATATPAPSSSASARATVGPRCCAP